MKFVLTLCLIGVGQFGYAQTPVSPSAGATTVTTSATTVATLSAGEKAVIDTEKQRFAAQVSKNYNVLERVLANDLIYTHSTGGTDTKQAYIQSIRDGRTAYDAIEVEEQKARVYDNTAIVNGLCLVKAINNGTAINNHLRYISVYVRNGKQWQLVAWQSLKLPN